VIRASRAGRMLSARLPGVGDSLQRRRRGSLKALACRTSPLRLTPLRTFTDAVSYLGCRREVQERISVSTTKEVIMLKAQAFKIAVTVSTLAMVIASTGAGKKWTS
jgi:hypothetical protein